ncbi:hypothetical protein GOP47_0018772 [Adiantum capillus-veneris]|uniref:Uncharacterized protein n=1 Tax=Adiantum capillus-veneris TaxID=13818 RepID=A0A9D4UDT8_ADICA|nr:hypothetical protein GOP47_0018772 [Adiantum capillus-veneris]
MPSLLHQQKRLRRRLPIALLLLTLLLLHTLPPVIAHGGADDDDGDGDADHEHGTQPNLRAKSLVLVKIYCLIIIFFATFIPGVSPYFCRWNHSFLVLGTQFAGGVFLGTAMLHFLSDANSTFEELTNKEYPFAFMLACAGYLFTMLGDCIIQHIFVKDGNTSRKPDVELGATTKGAVLPVVQKTEDAACKCDDVVINHESKNIVAATLVTRTSFTDTLLLILALCFHSVFEGIAIGVAENAGDAWRALWTISLHKVFAAIAMGIALLRMIPERPLLQTILYSFAFAISSPIGVAIGIIIDATTEGPVADWLYAIAMGIACGVFIYVAINHLFVKGYVPQCKVRVDTPFYKFLAVTLGVGVIAVVMIWD